MDIKQNDQFIGKYGEYKDQLVKVISVSNYEIIFTTKTEIENVVQAHSITRFYFEDAFKPTEEADLPPRDSFYEVLNDLFITIKSELLKMREREIVNENQAMLVTMMFKRLIQDSLNKRGKYDL